ncbi:class I SAM-dependent methyltransferase [Marimonas arenosa]|uniref:Class I SAM-dependent methyltransferase n=1 Tax=Marimonas arenosa TaxID=1795305 RepID=A0AAE3WDG5_9RHOB|nr:class I SAM-dependent methyltransferase [Marimonas arenosa]MDQ2090473.1 class I SAM-dependent methyltransferase [Marimonas arenosa]
MRKLDGARRHDILRLLGDRTGLVGVELGVAGGGFSKRMVDSGKFETFFGVDMYADTHDVDQYKDALRHVGLFAPYKLLRMSFAEAYDLFDDESLDFIYIDGYAHTGQEGGETIWHWARKVKPGGLIAGDDYHEDWPLVKEAVDLFAEVTRFELWVTTEVEPDVNYAAHPTWGMIKTGPVSGDPPSELVSRGKAASTRVARKRAAAKRFDGWLQRIVGEKRYQELRQWNRARKARRKSRKTGR